VTDAGAGAVVGVDEGEVGVGRSRRARGYGVIAAGT
jgi:hypothetical protein